MHELYSANYLFNTHLFGYILLGFLFYTFVGILWAGLFQIVFPGLLGNYTFASSLDALSPLVGFGYMIWFQRQAQGYTETYEQYRNMINYVKVAGDKLLGAFGGLSPEEKINARNDVLGLKTSIQFLIFYAYRIYAPWNRDELVTELGHKESVVVELLELGVHDRQAVLNSHREQIRIPKIPIELQQMHDEAVSGDPIALTHEIRGYMFREFTHLSSKNIFSDTIITFLHEELSALTRELNGIEQSRDIKRPTIFDKHLGFLLISYFGGWVPITMWIRLGFTVTVIVYPFILIILTGPWIYRKWLGNPFSSARPLELVKHKRWRNDAVMYLENLFKDAVTKK